MGHLVLAENKTLQKFRTNTTVKINIDGKTLFKPPAGGGQRILAMYANIWLPKQTTTEREAICRGGWRAWFQEVAPVSEEPDRRDETGYLGPIAIPRFGNRSLLISHSWPHGVDTDPWEFCVQVFAYTARGRRVSLPLTMGTRQIKFIDRL